MLFPVGIIITIAVLVTGGLPITYTQPRKGKYGRSFNIVKFRSMVHGAEEDGPRLAADDDKRITCTGRVIRKWRLDEIPQFINVLLGQMSIVGPRPERAYYADKIVRRLPDYKELYRVKPGITSAGMVEYGYAQNVDEMIERAAFDLEYLRSLSLMADFKIVLKTVKVIFDGKGK